MRDAARQILGRNRWCPDGNRDTQDDQRYHGDGARISISVELPACKNYLRAEEPAWAAASAPESFWTLKASSTSPIFTSLKLAMPTPHSKPVRTSLASSLKRLSELSFEV